MAFSPKTGLVYIPERVIPMVYQATETYEWKPDADNTGLNYDQLFNYDKVPDQVKEPADTTFSESLVAWNPVTQKPAWKVTDGAPDGGILATPGLIFQGTRTGFLKVDDAKTGQKLK